LVIGIEELIPGLVEKQDLQDFRHFGGFLPG
jgi:hypothetical protein